MSIFNQIRDIVVEQLELDPTEVTADTDFINELNADSLDLVEMIVAIEDNLGIDIDDQNAEKMTSIQKIMEYLAEKGIQ